MGVGGGVLHRALISDASLYATHTSILDFPQSRLTPPPPPPQPPHTQRYLKLSPEQEAALFQERVCALLDEHKALKEECEKLNKAKADLTKKAKELGDKVCVCVCVVMGELWREAGGRVRPLSAPKHHQPCAPAAPLSPSPGTQSCTHTHTHTHKEGGCV